MLVLTFKPSPLFVVNTVYMAIIRLPYPVVKLYLYKLLGSGISPKTVLSVGQSGYGYSGGYPKGIGQAGLAPI